LRLAGGFCRASAPAWLTRDRAIDRPFLLGCAHPFPGLGRWGNRGPREFLCGLAGGSRPVSLHLPSGFGCGCCLLNPSVALVLLGSSSAFGLSACVPLQGVVQLPWSWLVWASADHRRFVFSCLSGGRPCGSRFFCPRPPPFFSNDLPPSAANLVGPACPGRPADRPRSWSAWRWPVPARPLGF